MRGERPRTVAVLANAAPEAVLKRDASGLTPFHWLWIRFVSTLLALEDDGRGGGRDANILLRTNVQLPFETNRYNDFATIERGDLDADLQLIKRIDPPVDFLRMRHIPLEVLGNAAGLQWADRSTQLLKLMRERHNQLSNNDEQLWTRQEAVTSLFWTKAVSLLQASNVAMPGLPSGESSFVHTAFASPCSLAPVAHLAASLFPEELRILDDRGRLPIHYAACRSWHAWDWPRDDGENESAAARLLHGESLGVLRAALSLSHREAMRIADIDNCLVLHHVINTFVKACSLPGRSWKDSFMNEMLQILLELVGAYPISLQRRDGVTKLYPFLQATAVATENLSHDELSLSITYELLRENPAVLMR